MNDDVDSELLRRLTALTRVRSAYATANVFNHASDYVAPLEESISEAVGFMKENPALPSSGASKKAFVMLAVEITYAAGDVMRFLGAHSNAEADIIRGIKTLREAGKDEEAEKMEHYQEATTYALSRLRTGGR